jgi:hypothetical protein
MANSRLRAMAGLDNDNQEKIDIRISNHQNDTNQITEKKQELEEKIIEMIENEPAKKNEIEMIENEIKEIKEKIENINLYQKDIDKVISYISRLSGLAKNEKKVLKSVSKTVFMDTTGLGMVGDLLSSSNSFKKAQIQMQLRDELFVFLGTLDESNPVKQITKLEEYLVLYSIGDMTLDVHRGIEALLSKAREIKTQLLLDINNELKKENALSERIRTKSQSQ